MQTLVVKQKPERKYHTEKKSAKNVKLQERIPFSGRHREKTFKLLVSTQALTHCKANICPLIDRKGSAQCSQTT